MLYRFGNVERNKAVLAHSTAIGALLRAESTEYSLIEPISKKAVTSPGGLPAYETAHFTVIQNFEARPQIREFARQCGRISFQYWEPSKAIRDCFEGKGKLDPLTLREEINNADDKRFLGFAEAISSQLPQELIGEPLQALIALSPGYMLYLDRLLITTILVRKG